MRLVPLTLIVLLALSGRDTAQADQYKWCAAYGGSESGSYNCYFVTLQQCLATVTGIGGYCIRSPFANSPATPVQSQRRKKS